MTFEEYLISKKINKYAFQGAESHRFDEWKELFREMHHESFTAQKKFLINSIRRKYLLKEL